MKNDPKTMTPSLKYHAVKGTVDAVDKQSGKLARGFKNALVNPLPKIGWLGWIGFGVFVLIGVL